MHFSLSYVIFSFLILCTVYFVCSILQLSFSLSVILNAILMKLFLTGTLPKSFEQVF